MFLLELGHNDHAQQLNASPKGWSKKAAARLRRAGAESTGLCRLPVSPPTWRTCAANTVSLFAFSRDSFFIFDFVNTYTSSYGASPSALGLGFGSAVAIRLSDDRDGLNRPVTLGHGGLLGLGGRLMRPRVHVFRKLFRANFCTLGPTSNSSLAKPRPTRNTVVLLPYLRPSKRSTSPARCAMHLLRLRSTALPLLIVAARALIVRFSGDAQEKAVADRLRETQEEGLA